MKKIISLFMLLCLLTGCAPEISPSAPEKRSEISTPAATPLATDSGAPRQTEQPLISVIYGVGGIKDGSYNQSCHDGFERVAADFDLQIQYYESATESDYAQNIRNAIDDGSRLTVCTGFSMIDVLTQTAKENPDLQFAILDAVPVEPVSNITSVLFAQDQVSYLAGVAAAASTKSGIIGFVVGNAGPTNETMNSFGYGYIAGALDTNPQIRVLQFNANSFADLPGGKSAALRMAQQGADVIFHAAGGTGAGVIEGCMEAGIWAIGVDSDQSALSPDYVLTSAMKRLDNACYNLVLNFLKTGTLPGGAITYDLATSGVDIAPTTEKLSSEAFARIEAARAKIISGEITIPKTHTEFVQCYGDIYELN